MTKVRTTGEVNMQNDEERSKLRIQKKPSLSGKRKD